jgi:serine/threonine protein kinase
MSLEPGARLDAYEIVRPLGSGGMGEVWLATAVRLGRRVALKLLPADFTRDASRVLRFEQEARAASGLSHPNVCTTRFDSRAHRIWDDEIYVAEPSVAGNRMTPPIAEATGSIWMLDDVDKCRQPLAVDGSPR